LSACANRRGSVCPPVQIDGGLFVRLCKNDGGLFVRGSICPEPKDDRLVFSKMNIAWTARLEHHIATTRV